MTDQSPAAVPVNQVPERQLIISWPGHRQTVPLGRPEIRLGRAQDGNDIVLDHPALSSYHATLIQQDDGYLLQDGQTRNGEHHLSARGLYVRGSRVQQRRLEHGDTIIIPGANENFITLMYYDGQVAKGVQAGEISLAQPVTIGRNKDNTLVLDDPTISRFHARIDPAPSGHVLKDLDSENGTYVNGREVELVTLQNFDVVTIGSIQLQYDGYSLVPLDLRREGIQLQAIEVRRQVSAPKAGRGDAGYRILLDNVSIAIQPKEFLAIVGASGTGKSTLLDVLNGSRPADAGQVLINGDNLYQNFDAYRQSIGYVPQDDIVHLELTPEEALRFVARLRLPSDTPDEEIRQRVDEALQQVAMLERRSVLVKQLSGGQRKRVSIASELIADPGVLFLDEATSGLDPGLEKKLMFTLRQLADSGRTVILVTHATSNITECDLIAFLAPGGRLVFFGPPQEALTFFQVTEFAEIYHRVEQEPERWLEAFRTSSYYDVYVRQRLLASCPECGRPIAADQTRCPRCEQALQAAGLPLEAGRPSRPRHRRSLPRRLAGALRQTRVLVERNLLILLRDRRNLLVLLLQAPIIAGLLFLVMEPGLFTRGIETDIGTVNDIQKILFVIACVATWFGLINSVREIVKELPIYRRERLVNLSIPAYLLAKVLVFLLLSIVQAGLLVGIIAWRAQFPAVGVTFLPATVEVYVTIVLIVFTSACFGLFLSSIAGREDRVMTLLPIFLVPQIVFAGIVFNLVGVAKVVSWLTFSRWGIEALGASVNLPLLKKYASFSTPVGELAFPFSHTPQYLLMQWGILAAWAMVSIALAIVALERQDVH